MLTKDKLKDYILNISKAYLTIDCFQSEKLYNNQDLFIYFFRSGFASYRKVSFRFGPTPTSMHNIFIEGAVDNNNSNNNTYRESISTDGEKELLEEEFFSKAYDMIVNHDRLELWLQETLIEVL